MPKGMELVRSPDGTPIACWRSGSGPPMVLVHGTTQEHSRWEPLAPLLRPHATLYAMDRRGRGGSGDTPPYALERECEDVAAVVDAAAASGQPVDLFGHSFGALCALGAASRTPNLRSLILYEPVVLPNLGDVGFSARADALVAQGRRDAAVELMLRDLLGMAPEAVAGLRAQPSWQVRVAAAHTIGREDRAERAFRLDAARLRDVRVPTLMLAGELSEPALRESTQAVAQALPDARIAVLPGQGHFAVAQAPGLVAQAVLAFLAKEGSSREEAA